VLSLSRRFTPFIGAQAALWLLVAVLGVATLWPVLMVLLHSFRAGQPGGELAWSLAGWAAFSKPILYKAFGTTLALVIVQQAIAMVLGVALAWLLARTDLPGRNLFELLFWIPFFLPALPVTLGWILLLDPQSGLANRFLMRLLALQSAPFNIYSFWGIVWVHLSLYTVAVKVMLLTPAFRNLDAAIEEVALMSGCNAFQAVWRVTLPVLMPTLLMVLILSVIRNMEAFEVELLLGLPANIYVYSTLIYDQLRWTPPEYPPAMAMGSAFLAILALLVICQTLYLGKREYTTVSGRGFRASPIALRAWRWPCFAAVLLLAIALTVVPIISLITASFMQIFGMVGTQETWTVAHWRSVLADPAFLKSCRNTVLLGLATVACTVIVAGTAAYVIARTNFRGRRLLEALLWIPWGLPGILLGLGLLWTFLGNPVTAALYGTLPLLVLALAIKELPMATQMFKTAIAQVSRELEEAAYMSGATRLVAIGRILLPLVVRTVLAVAMVVLVVSTRDTSTVVLLASADSRPLSVLMLDYLLESKEYERAAVVGSVLAVAVLAAGLLSRLAGYRIGAHA